MQREREYFDIAVVVPLEDEIIPFMGIFPSLDDRSTATTFCHVVDSGSPDVSMVVIQQQAMGRTSASAAAGFLLAEYQIGLMVCLGIAGSMSDDMGLADVCYTGNVLDVLDNTKVVDVTAGTADPTVSDTEFSPTHYETPLEFTSAFSFMRTQPLLRPAYLDWQNERAKAALERVPAEVPGPGGANIRIGEPNTRNGCIACGGVSKSKVYNDKLRSLERSLLAIETEAGGVFAQAKIHSVPAIAIRGISDYADKDKKKLEQASKGGVRWLAAENAAAFLALQITNPRFLSALSTRRHGQQTELNLPDPKTEVDALGDALIQVAGEIDEALRKLSPEYRLQPKGYRLPIPRVRPERKDNALDSAEPVNPSDIRQALTRHDRILINLPRTYPDQSLGWVVAHDLLTAEFDGRQAVPIVIDAEGMRSKRSTFEGVAAVDYEPLLSHPGAKIVFIIENIPFSSGHRLDAVVKQIEQHPDAKYVFLARGEADLISETEFVSKSGSSSQDLCSISFTEISYFVQKNFEMTGSEAEVVALRLRDTFNRFDLDAHPTYFAGIPKETLAALLQANRRSELIQIAVDGFLTFIVAGDKADVALSRSTRERFLRRLVIDMNVEKRTFDQAALIQRVKEFAAKHDFDIDPMAFVQGFIDQGIMHFEADRVHISLPFIESYLLAAELAADPPSAATYFNLDDVYVDLATFDLYAEIGASADFVETVFAKLEASISELELKKDEDHILLGESISPPNIRKPERTKALRARLKSAAEAVQDGLEASKEKQELLDLSERIREASGRTRRKIHGHDKNEEQPEDALKPLSDMSRHWAVATVLLGSGAEHLDADIKRRLTKMIVVGASRLIDEWSRMQLDVDFEAIKRELTTKEMLDELPGPEDPDEKLRFVDAILDIMEYAAMADPVRRVMNFMCEQARQRVLATSVAGTTFDGPMERIIHGTWLADIDVARGKAPLKEAIKNLPRATFLRITLASHYMARVYWNHWRKDDRLFLLDAAEDAIKPIEYSINKAEMIRMVKRGPTKHNEEGVEAAE
jgi:nucleoside phosphorylase